MFKLFALVISVVALVLALDECQYVRAMQKRLQRSQKEEDEEKWNISWFP